MNSDGTIRVLSVNVSPGRGTAKTETDGALVTVDGLAADAHAGTPGRSVSLLDRGTIERFASETGIEMPEYGAFGENLTVRLEEGPALSVGDVIEFDGVVLLVSQVGKECHGEECSIYRRTGRCVMPLHGVFCTVLSGGTVSPGMTGRVRSVRTGP
jgi:MOSC domain-containing protein YiiM